MLLPPDDVIGGHKLKSCKAHGLRIAHTCIFTGSLACACNVGSVLPRCARAVPFQWKSDRWPRRGRRRTNGAALN
jgi:hypothetical protein